MLTGKPRIASTARAALNLMPLTNAIMLMLAMTKRWQILRQSTAQELNPILPTRSPRPAQYLSTKLSWHWRTPMNAKLAPIDQRLTQPAAHTSHKNACSETSSAPTVLLTEQRLMLLVKPRQFNHCALKHSALLTMLSVLTATAAPSRVSNATRDTLANTALSPSLTLAKSPMAALPRTK